NTDESASFRDGAGQHLAGTPLYMAPEVWRGEPATRQSYLYSLGILIYELLTGKAPFRDLGILALSFAVQEATIPPVAEVARDVDPALAVVVDHLLARDPAERVGPGG